MREGGRQEEEPLENVSPFRLVDRQAVVIVAAAAGGGYRPPCVSDVRVQASLVSKGIVNSSRCAVCCC